MNILIAADIFPPDIGGPATYVAGLSFELVRRGHRVRLVCYQSFRRTAPGAPFPVTRINNRAPLLVKYLNYMLALLARAGWADVIYAMGPVNAGVPALAVSRLLRRPLVVKVVGDYAWEQSWVQCGSRESIERFQKTAWFGKIGMLKRLERMVVRRASAVIVPSEYLRQLVRGWGARADGIALIYNSHHLVASSLSLQKSQADIGIEGDLVLTVARLVPWKNCELLIAIWPAVLKRFPRAKLVIVGEGGSFGRLMGLVTERGLEHAVYLLGRLTHADLARYYAAASVFALNSGYGGLSHVLLEALANRLVVVASDVGGNCEVITDGVNGFLVPYNNKDAWFDALVRALGDDGRKMRERLGQGAGFDLKRFSFERMVDETEKLLQRVAEM